jgi:hypothetical protein
MNDAVLGADGLLSADLIHHTVWVPVFPWLNDPVYGVGTSRSGHHIGAIRQMGHSIRRPVLMDWAVDTPLASQGQWAYSP